MLRVCDVMTSNVLTVDPGMTLREVVELFAAHHVSGAPVVSSGRAIGVISAADVITAGAEANRPVPVTNRGEEEIDWGNGRASDEEDSPASAFYGVMAENDLPFELESGEWLDRYTVDELMTRNICSLPPDASIVEAANYMRWANVHRILVIEGEQLLGILSTSDIVAAVAERRL